MGWLDWLKRPFQGAKEPEAVDVETSPAPVTPPAAPVSAVVAARPAPAAKPAPAPRAKTPRPPKPVRERGPSKKARKAAAQQAAPKAVAEVMSVAEAERRFGAQVRRPAPASPASPASLVEPESPPPPIPSSRPSRPARRPRKVEFERLLSRADALLGVATADAAHLDAALGSLRGGWARLGPAADEDATELAAALAARESAFAERLAAARAALAARWAENLPAKQAIVEEARALAEGAPAGAGPQMGELRKRFRGAGAVNPADEEALAALFASAEARLRERQTLIRTERDAAKTQGVERLEALAERAEALLGAADPIAAAERVKALQEQWKSVKVPGGSPDVLWQRFRAACDGVFARRAEARVAADAAAVARLEAIVLRAEAMADDADPARDPDDAITRLITEWKRAGFAPRDARDALWTRLQAAFDRARNPPVELPPDVDPRELTFQPFAGLTKD